MPCTIAKNLRAIAGASVRAPVNRGKPEQGWRAPLGAPQRRRLGWLAVADAMDAVSNHRAPPPGVRPPCSGAHALALAHPVCHWPLQALPDRDGREMGLLPYGTPHARLTIG